MTGGSEVDTLKNSLGGHLPKMYLLAHLPHLGDHSSGCDVNGCQTGLLAFMQCPASACNTAFNPVLVVSREPA